MNNNSSHSQATGSEKQQGALSQSGQQSSSQTSNHGYSSNVPHPAPYGAALPAAPQQPQQRWNANANQMTHVAPQQQQQRYVQQNSAMHPSGIQQNMGSIPQRMTASQGLPQQQRTTHINYGNQPQQQQRMVPASSFPTSQGQQPNARPAPSGSKPTSGNSATWGVPNPLLGGGHQGARAQVAPTPSAPQQRYNVAQQPSSQQQHHHQMQATVGPMKGPPPHPSQQAPAQGLPTHQMAHPSASVGKQLKNPTIMKAGIPGSKPKVTLTAEAKQALAKAIWSAIRSPTGAVAPALMEEALRTGLPQHAILNAARVAREREAMKRQGLKPPPLGSSHSSAKAPSTTAAASQHGAAHRQQQQQQQQQQQLHHNQSSNVHRSAAVPSAPSSVASKAQLMARSFQTQPSATPTTGTQKPKTPTPVPQVNKMKHKASSSTKPSSASTSKDPSPTSSKANAAADKAQQNLMAQRMAEKAKIEERTKWKRVQNGIFMVQKERFVALPFSVGAMVRSENCEPTLVTGRKRTRDPFAEARELQKRLHRAKTSEDAANAAAKGTAQLLDPERFKRIKVEPKKHARALDRHARKARQTVAEGLNKQLKELHKQIASHQTEFNKFHRGRKAEMAKISKSIRDTFDKEEKRKEKENAQAEKARMAALKANDMTAYSKLLEETRNDRLKFLMEKTEKQFSQIQNLLQQRSSSDGTDPAAASSYYATAHMKTEEVRQPSILVGGDLKEYQLTGLQWMISLYNNKLNGILADEMGLGKTIQAISLIAYLMEYKQNLGPFLVIVPLSTLSNWQNEFTKWCPAARVVCYKGLPIQRKEIYKDQVRSGQFNVLLTTYEYIIRDKKFLRKTEWQYAIVDEGHRMKNAESKFAVTLSSQYTTRHRILLTGTPLMNELSELWSLLNFLLPSVFNSVETFDQWFSKPFSQFGESKGEDDGEELISNEERILIIHRLHELLRPFMLRRVKSEVLDQLPEKVEKVLRCDLSSWQKELYKQISKKAVADSSLVSDQTPTRGLNNIVMQLRKVCNHPYLFTPEGYHIDDTIVRSSGKMALLDQMLPKLKLAGHRVLLFTQMTTVMTILEDYFALRGFLSLRLDGSTPAEEREKRMYKFNSPDSPYFIFLLSTRAGGLGLNLTAADTVIIFDSDWNPMMDLQAQDRAHRIGQRSSNVSVFRLITNSPVEEKILSRATEKLNVSELVVESGKFNKESVESDNSLERRRLMEVLLTDFDGVQAKDEKAISEDGDEEEEGSDAGEKEDLNELLSNNENDYQLYSKFDVERERKGESVASLLVDHKDVPDWILHPTPAGSATGNFAVQDMGNTSRKRKDVTYDDGLTEKQFLRIMDRKAREEEDAKKPKKKAKISKASSVGVSSDEPLPEPESPASVSTALTDWTFRKLISCSKSVVALKDPGTKRKLADVFLEKPDPATFPDYYEIVDKPIAINDILRKCRAKLYANLQEFKSDWLLMFANARKFNGDDSWVVEDASALEKELERVLKKNGFSEEHVPTSKKTTKKLRIKLSLKGKTTSSGDGGSS